MVAAVINFDKKNEMNDKQQIILITFPGVKGIKKKGTKLLDDNRLCIQTLLNFAPILSSGSCPIATLRSWLRCLRNPLIAARLRRTIKQDKCGQEKNTWINK